MSDYDKNIFAHNLRTMLEERGIKPAEIASRLQVSKSTVSSWCSGLKLPRMDKVEALADILQVTKSALIEDWSDSNHRPVPFGVSRVPRVGSIASGEPILAEQNIESYDTVPAFVSCDFTLICRDDSMINARICDGDIVCIKQQLEVENGQIAAVQVAEDSATLKRIRYLENGIALWSENPAYAPMLFMGDDMAKVRILGLATHFISRCI